MVTAFPAGRAYGEDKTRRPFQAGAQRILVPQGPSFLCLSEASVTSVIRAGIDVAQSPWPRSRP